jgi:hypothetical protein
VQGRLSWQQEGRLARDRDRDERVSNVVGVLRVPPTVDDRELQRRLDRLVLEEDTLRIVGLSYEKGRVEYADVRAEEVVGPMVEMADQDEIMALADMRSVEYFDRSEGPKWNLTPVQLRQHDARPERYLVGSFDHVMWDGMSSSLFADAMCSEAPRAGRRRASRYRSWVEWQRRTFPSPIESASHPYRGFWRDHLDGVMPDEPVELSFRRVPMPPPSRATVLHLTPRSTASALVAAARAAKAGPFVLVLAAVTHTVWLFGGSSDTVVRTNVLGRPYDHLETLGYFVDNLPVRVRGSGLSSPRGALELARRAWFDTLPHHDTPWDYLLSAAMRSEAPITRQSAQILVNYQHWAEPAGQAPESGSSTTSGPTSTFQVGVTCWDDDTLRVSFHFDEARFNVDGSHDFSQAVVKTLDEVVQANLQRS